MTATQYEVGWYRDKVHELTTENERLKVCEANANLWRHEYEQMRAENERLTAELREARMGPTKTEGEAIMAEAAALADNERLQRTIVIQLADRNKSAIENERLTSAGRTLLKAMDDMHERGETFTARVSIAAAELRRALEPKP